MDMNEKHAKLVQKVMLLQQETLDQWIEEHAANCRADCIDIKRDYARVAFTHEPLRFGLAYRGRTIRVSKIRVNGENARLGCRPRR